MENDDWSGDHQKSGSHEKSPQWAGKALLNRSNFYSTKNAETVWGGGWKREGGEGELHPSEAQLENAEGGRHQKRWMGKTEPEATKTSWKQACVSGSLFFASTLCTCHMATAATPTSSNTAPSFCHTACTSSSSARVQVLGRPFSTVTAFIQHSFSSKHMISIPPRMESPWQAVLRLSACTGSGRGFEPHEFQRVHVPLFASKYSARRSNAQSILGQ